MNSYLRKFLVKILWLYVKLMQAHGIKFWHTYFEVTYHKDGSATAIRRKGFSDADLERGLRKAGFDFADEMEIDME